MTKILLGVLVLQLIGEILGSITAIFTPVWGLETFHVSVSADTCFLAFVLGLAFAFVSVIILLAIYGIYKKIKFGWYISYSLGFFWIVFGGSLFLMYGRTENFYMDFCPGLLVGVLTYLSYQNDIAKLPGK